MARIPGTHVDAAPYKQFVRAAEKAEAIGDWQAAASTWARAADTAATDRLAQAADRRRRECIYNRDRKHAAGWTCSAGCGVRGARRESDDGIGWVLDCGHPPAKEEG